MTRAHQAEYDEATPTGARRGLRGLLAAGLLAAAAGCGPDPEGKFNEFLDETKQERDIPPPKEDIPTSKADVTGDFLLALSTVVAKDYPLQFVATNTLTVMEDGSEILSVCLQPLALDPQKVTVPRTPIGEPLCFENIPVVDGKYTVDAGEVSVTGKANPITGSDITATLVMAANVIDKDFVCGTVTGEVLQPPVGSIEGSTFASVRLEDPAVLPKDVTINCEGETRTDSTP